METLTQGYGLVEGPLWVPGQGLLFSDVLFGGVYCLGLDDQVSIQFEHRRGVGGMVLHEQEGVVVSGRNIGFKAFAGGPSLTLLDRDEAAGNVGYNDITSDPAGRIYAGSLGASPVFEDGREPQSGDLYLIDVDGNARVVANDIRLTNGLGLSPDGKWLYHSDTHRNTVHKYAVSPDGSLGPKDVLAVLPGEAPDGLAVSQDGRVWVALASSSCVVVLDASGAEVERVSIPVPMCTSVCFGGDDLKDLYIVSGSNGTGSEKGGGVYRTRADSPGVPVPLAKVALPT